MAWKPDFEQGTILFKAGQHAGALSRLDQAIANGGENQFILYDARAATYEALDDPRNALRDAKTAIQLAPRQWQGYARAARIFMKTHKFDASLKMIERALSHVKPTDDRRLQELLKLKTRITDTQEALDMRLRSMQNHMAKLPAELFTEIFQLVLVEDSAEMVTLLHICAHWRQIIWNSPVLWHTLVLSKSRADQKAALWLKRSCRRIKELHVLSDYRSNGTAGTTFPYEIDWSYLRVCRIHHYPTLQIVATMGRHAIPRDLSHLELKLSVKMIPEPIIFRSSSRLKSLSFRETIVVPRYFEGPYLSLTSLYIEISRFIFQSSDQVLKLFRAFPQLESLRLKQIILYYLDEPSINHSDVDLPSLNYLTTLELDGAPGFSRIFLLNIPALQTLRLVGLPSHQIGHLQNWMSTSPNCLTELSLSQMTIDKSLLLALLQNNPKLESLTLNHMFGSCVDIIQALSQQISSSLEEAHPPCLCPCLKHLDVSYCPDVGTSIVQELVKQRLALSSSTTSTESEHEQPAQEPIKVNRLEVLKMDGCEGIDLRWLPWFIERVPQVSCSMSKSKQRGVAGRINGF